MLGKAAGLDPNQRSVSRLDDGSGGRGGIRTHGGLAPTAVFKTAALNHSATLPGWRRLRMFTRQRQDFGPGARASKIDPAASAPSHAALFHNLELCRNFTLIHRRNRVTCMDMAGVSRLPLSTKIESLKLSESNPSQHYGATRHGLAPTYPRAGERDTRFQKVRFVPMANTRRTA